MSVKSILKDKIIPTLAGLFKIKTDIVLVPYSQIDKENELWRSTGEDPAFLLDGRFFSGWNVMIWRSKSDEAIPLKLYWDRGNGFSEKDSITFASIPKGPADCRSFLYIPRGAQRLRIDPGEQESTFSFEQVALKKVTRTDIAIRSITKLLKARGFNFATSRVMFLKAFKVIRKQGVKGLWAKLKKQAELESVGTQNSYEQWILANQLTENDIVNIKDNIKRFEYQPLVSVILPVYNVEEKWLRKCIDSVVSQYYENWELCIADDASPKDYIKSVLEEYCRREPRVKVTFRSDNGHISRSSNSALELATGEYIALLDHDDELTPDALYENVLLMNENRDADVIYSDEDKITMNGQRCDPFFKPDWSPDLLMSQMYTCHLTLYRKELVDKLGGFRVGYEGSQDFDLMLRVSELTNHIYHIPKVLYHWRIIPTSTASGSASKDYTQDAGYRSVQDAIRRRNLPARVEPVFGLSNTYNVKYLPVGNPLVSIIIPSRNMASTLEVCIRSIFKKTSYHNFEVIIVDNGSTEDEVFELYQTWEQKEPQRFRVCTLDIPFNYSTLNNFGVQYAQGELLLLLNNDIEVISENWLTDMAGQAIRPEIGAVGAALYYPDNTLQHGGVILGIGGVAGHSHKHFSANHPGYFNRLSIPSNYTAVTAACLMVRKEVYEEVGGLEEKLQVAFNDVDLCLKIWREGYNNIWLPDVKLYHYESKSRGYEDTPEKVQRFSSEVEWIKSKWGDVLTNDPAYNRNLTLISEDFTISNCTNNKYHNNQAINIYPRKTL